MAQVVLKLQRAAGRCAVLAAAPHLRLAQGLATDSGGSEGDEPTVISIDRSGLGLPDVQQQQGGSVSVQKEPETDMARHLKQLIQFRGGPITVAEYMKEVLTHPSKGFYMRGDVFGGSGHFTTSPEVSQLFGEMVGIWTVHVWELMGQPPKLRLVELGPGRGTLMSDLLRSTAVFKSFAAAVRVSMVEVSPPLREMQYASLQCQPGDGDDPASGEASARRRPERGEGDAEAEAEEAARAVLQGVSALNGAAVSWHRSLQEVPQDAPTVVVAHELFDALPVHQFVRVPERGWLERMVDMAGPDSPQHLRFVLSPRSTVASKLLVQRFLAELPPDEAEKRTSLEISPQIGERVAALGGAALIVDYGHDGAFDSSLQAIRNHKFVGLLEQPGLADLSVRVDFSALRRAVQTSAAAAVVHGPVMQQSFLLSLGIQQRLEALVRSATPSQAEQLVRGFLRLVGGHHHTGGPAGSPPRALPGTKEKDAEPDAEGMGLQYKVLAICSRDLPEPAGFKALESS